MIDLKIVKITNRLLKSFLKIQPPKEKTQSSFFLRFGDAPFADVNRFFKDVKVDYNQIILGNEKKHFLISQDI